MMMLMIFMVDMMVDFLFWYDNLSHLSLTMPFISSFSLVCFFLLPSLSSGSGASSSLSFGVDDGFFLARR